MDNYISSQPLTGVMASSLPIDIVKEQVKRKHHCAILYHGNKASTAVKNPNGTWSTLSRTSHTNESSEDLVYRILYDYYYNGKSWRKFLTDSSCTNKLLALKPKTVKNKRTHMSTLLRYIADIPQKNINTAVDITHHYSMRPDRNGYSTHIEVQDKRTSVTACDRDTLYRKLYVIYCLSDKVCNDIISHENEDCPTVIATDNTPDIISMPLKEVCESLSMSFEHALFIVATQFKNNEYGYKNGDNFNITYRGLLELFRNGCNIIPCQEPDKAKKQMENFLDVFNTLHPVVVKQDIIDKNDMDKLTAAMDVLKSLTVKTKEQTPISTQVSVKCKKSKTYYEQTKIFPEYTTDEEAWQERMSLLAKNKVLLIQEQFNKKTTATILIKRVYKIMTNNYGIVWAQSKKELLEILDLPKETYVSIYRIITYEPDLRSIFEPILLNIEKYI